MPSEAVMTYRKCALIHICASAMWFGLFIVLLLFGVAENASQSLISDWLEDLNRKAVDIMPSNIRTSINTSSA